MSLVHFDAIRTGWVSKHFSSRFFLLYRGIYNNNVVFADEGISTEMKSLSILYAGGRGQPMLASGNRRRMEPAEKVDDQKKGGRYIPSTLYYAVLFGKNTQNKIKIRNPPN